MNQPDFWIERQLSQSLPEEIARFDRKGFYYKGEFIDDAGEVHRLLKQVLEGKLNIATPPPEDNTKPGFINACIEGPPPAPYEYWEDWLVDTIKNRTIKGVCIRALISGDFSFDKKEVATPPPEPPKKPTEQEVADMAEELTWKRLPQDDESIDSFLLDVVNAALERWGR